MSLAYYARAVRDSRGILHQIQLRALRDHIRARSVERIIEEINAIDDVTLLRTLWEAGLPPELQKAVLERARQLTVK